MCNKVVATSIDSIFIISSITRSIVCKILLHVVSCGKEHVQIILEQDRLVPCTNHFGTEYLNIKSKVTIVILKE